MTTADVRSEPPRPYRVLHLSDVHATARRTLHGGIDGAARLVRAAEYARTAGLDVQAVVVTGDLVERGNADAYSRVADACARAAEALDAPVLTVLGNHDDPEAARALPGHGTGHDRAVEVGEYRFVLLDSSDGGLGDAQLDWLRAELREPAGRGTIVALHHPPIPSPLPVLRGQHLRGADELLDVLAESDTRAVLCGHYHHQLTGALRGIPVFVGPSLAYHQVMHLGPDTIAGYDAPALSLVEFSTGCVAQSSAELRDPERLFTRDLHQISPSHPNRK